MPRFAPAVLTAALLHVTGPGNLTAQAPSGTGTSADRLVPHQFSSPSLHAPIGYLEYRPPAPDSAPPGPVPVLIFLHGDGERGNGAGELSRLLKWGLPRFIAHGGAPPLTVIAPQLPLRLKRWPVVLIDELLAAVAESLPVDRARIYLTGLSTGGDATWAYALAHPGVVAAIVPIAASGGTDGICALRGVAVWAFHGERDQDEHLDGARRPVEALNRCDPPPPEPARLTIYAGAGHEVWTRTYDGSAGHDIYTWLLAHHR